MASSVPNRITINASTSPLPEGSYFISGGSKPASFDHPLLAKFPNRAINFEITLNV